MPKVRIPLLVTGGYGVLVGVVQLFPGVAEAVFGRAVIDPAVESSWGGTLLALGLALLAVARSPRAAEVLALPAVAGLVIQSGTLTYWWLEGSYAAGTALPPLVINLVLAAWIAFAASRSAGSVTTASG